jgi:hypothetical protein
MLKLTDIISEIRYTARHANCIYFHWYLSIGT